MHNILQLGNCKKEMLNMLLEEFVKQICDVAASTITPPTKIDRRYAADAIKSAHSSNQHVE